MTRGCEYIEKKGYFCPMLKLDIDCSRNKLPCIYAETHKMLDILASREQG
ncbi:MAG: hypothetical protein QXJ68_03495 [Methanocellales archaeon]